MSDRVSTPVSAQPRLLGAHVLRRANHAANLRCRYLREGRAQRFRDAEVDDLHDGTAVPIMNENVGGFQIPVQDAFLMRVLNGVAHLKEQLEPRVDWKRVQIGERRNGRAIDVLHREIRQTIVGEPGVEDRCDVRMTENRERLTFCVEPRQIPALNPLPA